MYRFLYRFIVTCIFLAIAVQYHDVTPEQIPFLDFVYLTIGVIVAVFFDWVVKIVVNSGKGDD